MVRLERTFLPILSCVSAHSYHDHVVGIIYSSPSHPQFRESWDNVHETQGGERTLFFFLNLTDLLTMEREPFLFMLPTCSCVNASC